MSLILLEDAKDELDMPDDDASSDKKLQHYIDGMISEAEGYMDAKIEGVTDEVAYFDGGKSYLMLPHLNISNVSVWEDLSRTFDSSTLIDPSEYQVYTERGILRIGNPKDIGSGGIAWMDRYWDDTFFEGCRAFLRGRLVIKVKYDGGYDSDTINGSLKMALLKQISYRFRRRKDLGLSTVTYPDGSISKMADIKQFLLEVQAVLDKFKRISIA